MDNYKEDYLGVLDGVRGLMAFWVFFYHLMAYSIGKLTPWGSGSLAVEIFMFLSGFLMAYHWEIRQHKFPSFYKQVGDFYTRRFFRIAPLYYILLTVALLGHEYFFSAKNFIETITTLPWIDGNKVVVTHGGDFNGILNAIFHYTFLFGLFPQYASNNALPDWSIGLEMQFYFLLPFIMLAFKRFGPLTMVLIFTAISFSSKRFLGLFDLYSQPSLILFKINLFVAGICFAFAYLHRNKIQCIPWLILCFLSIARSAIQVQVLVFFIVFLMLLDPKKEDGFHRFLSGRFAKSLGDTSYSVYLIHFLVLYPVLSILFHYKWFIDLSPYPRLAVSFLLIGVPVYGLSYILFRLVELPGIKLGKHFCK